MATQIKSDMAGSIWEYLVKVGDDVKVGQEVVILESMKMEVPLVSQKAGKVAALLKAKGDFVNEGEAVIELS